jgi:hypothetical protein
MTAAPPAPLPDLSRHCVAEEREIRETLRYALTFDDRGKPLSRGERADADLMAGWLVRQLLRSNFLVLRREADRY